MKKTVIEFLRSLISRPSFQPLMIKLRNLSFIGMNIGYGASKDSSGEAWVIKNFAKYTAKLSTPVVLFDVGANEGFYTKDFIEVLGNRVECYCFEPSQQTFQKLTQNLSNFSNVKLFNFGFGEKEEEIELNLFQDKDGDTLSGLSSIYDRNFPEDFSLAKIITNVVKEKIILKKMDNFCQEEGINKINYLKIDTEGNDYRVLLGAKNLIQNSQIDFIQFEFAANNMDAKTFFLDYYDYLKDNYRIYRILLNGVFLIDKYEHSLENFMVSNFLAISKKIQFGNTKLS